MELSNSCPVYHYCTLKHWFPTFLACDPLKPDEPSPQARLRIFHLRFLNLNSFETPGEIKLLSVEAVY